MQAIIFVHKDDVDKANEIAEKFGGPQAKNTFNVPYDKDWFIACWTMKSNLYNELKNAGLCLIDYKKEKKEAIKKEVENQAKKGSVVSKDKIQIDKTKIISSLTKERISEKIEEKPAEKPAEKTKE